MRSTKVEKSVLEPALPAFRAPDKGRLCVRGENERGVELQGQGIQRSSFTPFIIL